MDAREPSMAHATPRIGVGEANAPRRARDVPTAPRRRGMMFRSPTRGDDPIRHHDRGSMEASMLAERVKHALRDAGYSDLDAVDVSIDGELVVLRGRVPSYYLKQIAQAVVIAVPGVAQCRNDVEARRRPRRWTP
jgi:hypothetical protein